MLPAPLMLLCALSDVSVGKPDIIPNLDTRDNIHGWFRVCAKSANVRDPIGPSLLSRVRLEIDLAHQRDLNTRSLAGRGRKDPFSLSCISSDF